MIPRPILIALAVVAISTIAYSIYSLGRESAEANSIIKIRRQEMRLIKRALFLSAVLTMAACSTFGPASVGGVERTIGNALPGAKGETIKDQDRIADTVARAYAAGIYRAVLCDLHTQASADRRAELARIEGAGV